MKKIIISLSVTIIFVFALTGCNIVSSAEDEVATKQTREPQSGQLADETSEKKSDESILTLDDIANGDGGVFLVKRGEGFVDPTEGLPQYNAAAYLENHSTDILYSQVVGGKQNHFTYDRSSSDQVVTTSTTARFIPVSKIGFWSGHIQEKPMFASIEEFNGANLSDASEEEKIAQLKSMGILARSGDFGKERGFLYISDEVTDISFGWYSDTRWNKETLSLDVPCFIAGSITSTGATYCYSVEGASTVYDHEIICTRTKEGYFSVDMSNVEPGLYFLIDGGSVLMEVV